MLYDVTRFITLFTLLYLLRFGPNKYSVLFEKYNQFSELTQISKETNKEYSVVVQFSGYLKNLEEKDPSKEEEILTLISGYFSERDIVID